MELIDERVIGHSFTKLLVLVCDYFLSPLLILVYLVITKWHYKLLQCFNAGSLAILSVESAVPAILKEPDLSRSNFEKENAG